MKTEQFATIVALLCLIAGNTTTAGTTTRNVWHVLSLTWLVILALNYVRIWRSNKGKKSPYELSNN